QQGTARVRVEVLADESRLLAGQAPAGAGQMAAGEPVPEAAPRVPVTTQDLATGATSSSGASASGASAAAQSTAVQQLAAPAPIVPDGRVTQLPVSPTSIYVQAGAFTDIYNATRLQAQLRQF